MRAILTAAALLALLACGGCVGTTPERYGESTLGYSAVLVRGRFITPDGGEDLRGRIDMNLESEDGERYRLRFTGGETTLLRIEPDTYRLHPTRNIFGFIKKDLTAFLGRMAFRVPYPRSILRKPPFEAKPMKIVPIGILEFRLLPVSRGKGPEVVVSLDDSVDARRLLVQDMIRKMMDSRVPSEIRSSAISWTRGLEQSLSLLQGEQPAPPPFKPAQP